MDSRIEDITGIDRNQIRKIARLIKFLRNLLENSILNASEFLPSEPAPELQSPELLFTEVPSDFGYQVRGRTYTGVRFFVSKSSASEIATIVLSKYHIRAIPAPIPAPLVSQMAAGLSCC